MKQVTTSMEIHLCLFQLDEAHPHTAELLDILPYHQRTPFCRPRYHRFHALFLQLPKRSMMLNNHAQEVILRTLQAKIVARFL